MNNENSIPIMEDALKVLSEAYFPPEAVRSSEDHILESAEKLAKLASQVQEKYALPLRYHEARFLAMAGDIDKASELLDYIIQSKTPLPEALWLNIQLKASAVNEESNSLRWSLEDELGLMLPISRWGMLRDTRLEENEAEKTGHPIYDTSGPIIPLLESEKLFRIAFLFYEMKMIPETANAYREAVYGTLMPPDFPEFGRESWASEEAADSWLKIAIMDAMLGGKMWGTQALLMAVASSKSHLSKAEEILKKMLSDQVPMPTPAPDLAKLTEIAMLYRDCNIHPRAILTLNEAEKALGANVSKLKNDIEKSWNELVTSYARGKESICFLFGSKVSDYPSKIELSPKTFPYGDDL